MPFRRVNNYAFVIFLLILAANLCLSPVAIGGNPGGAHYSADNTNIFWFIHIADDHVGYKGELGLDPDKGYENLKWIVGDNFDEGVGVINPNFIVDTGDLVNSGSTTVEILLDLNEHEDEWEDHRAILDDAGRDRYNYYDLIGNHDFYKRGLSWYLEHSIQGSANNQTQHSWVREFNFGTYHFIGADTTHPDGVAPLTDLANECVGELSDGEDSELDFIQNQLSSHQDANLTFVFGHHPVHTAFGWGEIEEPGKTRFIQMLKDYGASYVYGHIHEFTENMMDDGVLYYSIASLGKSDDHHYAIFAVDNDGLSVVSQKVKEWPVVLITTPINKELGGKNPYAYSVPSPFYPTIGSIFKNPIRALVFDEKWVDKVQYRIDGGDWHPMSKVRCLNDDKSYLWEGLWDCTFIPAGDYTIEVEATGSNTISNTIAVEVVKVEDLTASSGAEKAGCFIATAVFSGSRIQDPGSQLNILRRFRDEYLLTNTPGRAFVRFYYRHSPRVADFIRDKESLKTIVRAGLKPMVWVAKRILE